MRTGGKYRETKKNFSGGANDDAFTNFWNDWSYGDIR